jgi:hypothetical protein
MLAHNSDKELPFLLPRPIKVPDDWSASSETKIILPFAEFPPKHTSSKDTNPKKTSAYTRMSQLLGNRLPPITLLFLRRLRLIEIKCKQEHRLTKMERVDGANSCEHEFVNTGSIIAAPFPELSADLIARFRVSAKPFVSSLLTTQTTYSFFALCLIPYSSIQHCCCCRFDGVTSKSQIFLIFTHVIAVPEHIQNLMKEKFTRPETVSLSIAFPWKTARDSSELEWQVSAERSFFSQSDKPFARHVVV